MRTPGVHRDRTGGSVPESPRDRAISEAHRDWPGSLTDSMLLERFSGRARRALSLSEQEARGLGHGHVGTEHLLLGILAAGDSPAAAALAAAGASLSGCRELTAEAVGARGASAGSQRLGELPLTERANRSLERAARLALRRRDPEVEPTHILLSVLDVEGRAGQVLRGLGVDMGALRRSLESPAEAAGANVEAPAAETAPARRPASVKPACPECGCALDEHLAHEVLESKDSVSFVVAYCGACGAAISATPA